MCNYRDNPVYAALEELITRAGVRIEYEAVPDDSIDGAIWARCNHEGNSILMPDSDEFPDDETAGAILGHEMAHILTGLDSPDMVIERRLNEAICDQVGVYLYRLAEMIAAHEVERNFENAIQGIEL